MATVEDLADTPARDPFAAAEALNELLSLPASAAVRGARVIGQGSRATVEIDLANGDMMVFESIRDMARPANLIAELAACAGVAIAIKQQAAVRAIVLVRELAEHHRATTDNDAAADWGASYLQSATLLDVDMEDQRERWAAFCRLRDAQHDVESAEAPGREHSYAGATIVLRSHTGARFVRSGWFQGYVRREDSTVSRQAVSSRMLRVGWQSRSTSGRIKATRPGYADALSWAFLIVPSGWEEGL